MFSGKKPSSGQSVQGLFRDVIGSDIDRATSWPVLIGQNVDNFTFIKLGIGGKSVFFLFPHEILHFSLGTIKLQSFYIKDLETHFCY